MSELVLRIEERTRCEVWTRVMGYHRPVGAWNLGKQAEHRDRLPFREQPTGAGGASMRGRSGLRACPTV